MDLFKTIKFDLNNQFTQFESDYPEVACAMMVKNLEIDSEEDGEIENEFVSTSVATVVLCQDENVAKVVFEAVIAL